MPCRWVNGKRGEGTARFCNELHATPSPVCSSGLWLHAKPVSKGSANPCWIKDGAVVSGSVGKRDGQMAGAASSEMTGSHCRSSSKHPMGNVMASVAHRGSNRATPEKRCALVLYSETMATCRPCSSSIVRPGNALPWQQPGMLIASLILTAAPDMFRLSAANASRSQHVSSTANAGDVKFRIRTRGGACRNSDAPRQRADPKFQEQSTKHTSDWRKLTSGRFCTQSITSVVIVTTGLRARKLGRVCGGRRSVLQIRAVVHRCGEHKQSVC
jgi:hypothetical protein